MLRNEFKNLHRDTLGFIVAQKNVASAAFPCMLLHQSFYWFVAQQRSKAVKTALPNAFVNYTISACSSD